MNLKDKKNKETPLNSSGKFFVAWTLKLIVRSKKLLSGNLTLCIHNFVIVPLGSKIKLERNYSILFVGCPKKAFFWNTFFHTFPKEVFLNIEVTCPMKPCVPLSIKGVLQARHIRFICVLALKLSRAFKHISKLPKNSRSYCCFLILSICDSKFRSSIKASADSFAISKTCNAKRRILKHFLK